jgi:hypothetical protein
MVFKNISESFLSTIATSQSVYEKYIVLDFLFESSTCGIANEKIIRCYNDYPNCTFSLKSDFDKQFDICCFLPELDGNFQYLFRVISILNKLPKSNISLYVDAPVQKYIATYCNSHICVLPFENNKNLNITANVILSYGSTVIHFLRNKIPIIVLGPRGVGGLVTPTNFYFLFQTGFMGRPGNKGSEELPVEIVAHELELFKSNRSLENIVDKNKELADSIPLTPLSIEIQDQKNLNEIHYRFFADLTKRNVLKPKICSNVSFIYDNDCVFVMRDNIGDTLCTVDQTDASFFIDLNGENTCACLQRLYNLSETEFWEIMHGLINKQIITMSL